MQWRLAVTEKLILGKNNLIHAAHIRKGAYTCPIFKLNLVEVSSVTQAIPDNTKDKCTGHLKDTQTPFNNTFPSRTHPRWDAASKASQKLYEWAKILRWLQRTYSLTVTIFRI